MLLLLLLACTSPEPDAPPELRFLRGAVLLDAPTDGARALPGERWLKELSWTPGEAVELAGASAVAPLRPECAPLFEVPLGDVSRLVAMGPTAQPGSALAFSPDGAWLAVGSHLGELLLIDAWSGEVKARRRLAETMVKGVAWSLDGATLYAAEQSPDAFVRALDPATLTDRWTFRLADVVESSTPPAGEDLYGVFSLPAAYGLEPLPDGGLLLVGLHSWSDDAGVKQNRSQVLRLDAAGQPTQRWPERPADATLLHPRVDVEGGLVLVVVDRTADGPPPPNLPIGGVQLLSLDGLKPLASATAAPLKPHFTHARIWDALDVSAASDRLYMGFSDGRVQLRRASDAALITQLDAGSPVMAGDVPIHATVSYGFLRADDLVFATNATHIPWGAASPDLQAPAAHPRENTLWDLDLDGQERWTWSGEPRIEGVSLGADGRHALVGAGARTSDSRRDLYGGLVFDLDGAERSGEERLEVFCRTEGPVSFEHAMSADGRVALLEHPYLDESGASHGAYRLSVMR